MFVDRRGKGSQQVGSGDVMREAVVANLWLTVEHILKNSELVSRLVRDAKVRTCPHILDSVAVLFE
jgi:hypothetical protein